MDVIREHFQGTQNELANLLTAGATHGQRTDQMLAAQAEQFGTFDPVLRDLHGEMVTLHERLTALESVESAQFLDNHEQRRGETEQ